MISSGNVVSTAPSCYGYGNGVVLVTDLVVGTATYRLAFLFFKVLISRSGCR